MLQMSTNVPKTRVYAIKTVTTTMVVTPVVVTMDTPYSLTKKAAKVRKFNIISLIEYPPKYGSRSTPTTLLNLSVIPQWVILKV